MAGSDVATLGVVGAMFGGLLTAARIDPRVLKFLWKKGPEQATSTAPPPELMSEEEALSGNEGAQDDDNQPATKQERPVEQPVKVPEPVEQGRQ